MQERAVFLPTSGPLFGRFLILIGSLLLAAPAASEEIEYGTRKHPGFGRVQLTGVRQIRGRDATPDLSLTPHKGNADRSTLLHLSFDETLPVLLRDQAGNYRLERAAYSASPDARVGRGAALFLRRESRVIVNSPPELWPGTGALGDFTIEFWMKPVHFGRRSVILERRAMSGALEDGQSRGLTILLAGSRVHVVFRNLFRDIRDRPRTLRLASRSSIRRGQWTHVVLGYSAASGRAALYLNGREERVGRAADKEGIWQAVFSPLDRSPLVIGQSFLGLLDEFRIAKGAPPSEEQISNSVYPALRYDPVHLHARQSLGRAVSGVIRLRNGRLARKAELSVAAHEPEGSALSFYVRTSPQRFAARTPEHVLPWQPVGSKAMLTEFAYFQWKAELRAEPTGDRAPTLEHIRLSYTPYPRPVPPQSPAVVEALTGGRSLALEWLANPEPEVREHGGYAIYYGYRPGEYLGRILYRFEGEKPARINVRPAAKLPLTRRERVMQQQRPRAFEHRFANRIRLRLTNRLIERNLIEQNRVPKDASSPPRPTSAGMPLLDSNRTYYLAIAAYYQTKSGAVLESQNSREVIAVLRPGGRLKQP